MRSSFYIIITIFFLGFLYNSKAEDTRIAFVNSEKIMNEYADARRIKDELTEFNNEKEKEANKLLQEITNLEKEYEDFNVLVSKEKRLNKKEEIQLKREEYLKFKEKIWGFNGEFYKKNKTLNKPVLKKINEVIAEFCEKEKYDLIIDATTGALIYGKKDNDVTDKIIDLLNKRD